MALNLSTVVEGWLLQPPKVGVLGPSPDVARTPSGMPANLDGKETRSRRVDLG